MRIKTVFNKLLSLQGAWVRSVRFGAGEITVAVARKARLHRCPRCEFSTAAGYDQHVGRWRHVALGKWRVSVTATGCRIECPTHGVLTEAVPWAVPESRFTLDFEDLVAWLAREMNKTAVMRRVRVTWRTVGRVVERKIDKHRLDELYVIGLDEVSYISGAAKGAQAIGMLDEVSPLMKYVDTPYIIDLLVSGHYQEVVDHLLQKYGMEYGKAAVYSALHGLATRLGLTKVVEFLEAFAGPAAGATLAMVKWTYDGFKQIHAAHERGDRDSRIAIYSAAFADAFLFGRGAGNAAGAVTPEQREAFELGDRDGAATAGATGDQAAAIGKSLLQKHGDAHGARQAIINALLERAGIGGARV